MSSKHSIRPHNPAQTSVQSLTGKPTYYRTSLYSADMVRGDKNEAVFNTKELFPNQRQDLMNGEWEVFVERFSTTTIDAPSSQRYNSVGVKVCLPDVCANQDFRSVLLNAAGERSMMRDDCITMIPREWTIGVDPDFVQQIPHDLNAITTETYDIDQNGQIVIPAETVATSNSTVPPQPAVNLDRPPIKEDYQLQQLPFAYSRTITAQDIGVKVNPTSLMSGQLRVAMRNPTGRLNRFNGAIGDNLDAAVNNHDNFVGFADGENWFLSLLFVHKP